MFNYINPSKENIMIRQRTNFKTVKSATQISEAAAFSRHESVCPDSSGCPRGSAAGGAGKYHRARLRSLVRFLPAAGLALTLLLASGCAHLAIDQQGAWTGPLPQPVTVKEAARIEPPWYGKVVAPFFITLFSGSRIGLEYNEGRTVRTTEYIRGIPYAGMVVLPYFCYESLTKETMQGVANDKGIDKRRERKYRAVIRRLEHDGRGEEANFLKVHDPFDPVNHPPNPLARMPRENLKGTKGVIKTLWVELAIGHRNSLERNESRGVRKLEYWHPLILTRIYEAFEAGAGRRMEDVAEKEGLDERWLPKPASQAELPDRIKEQASPRVTAN
ncbi:MAG: hypothetical protein O2960_21785 [Verrucomicrobia bacterium]|nr:hypothetical protein [Verrucomicrobiota bacterium]